jgi:hypothetical protein
VRRVVGQVAVAAGAELDGGLLQRNLQNLRVNNGGMRWQGAAPRCA